jgi:hypothetical protein
MRMEKLIRLRHAQQRIVRVQRRVWLAQVLMWPTVIAAGVSSVGGLVWILQCRYAGGRHEMPDTPGAHKVGTAAAHAADAYVITVPSQPGKQLDGDYITATLDDAALTTWAQHVGPLTKPAST